MFYTEANAGDRFRSSWGIEAVVLGVREVTGKRNLMVMWVDVVTNQKAYKLMSLAELQRSFRYKIA